MCFFVCHMTVMCWLEKKQVFLWNIKFDNEKFKICALYTEMHSLLLVCLLFT